MRTELRKAKEVDSKLEGDGFVQEIERFIRLDEVQHYLYPSKA